MPSRATFAFLVALVGGVVGGVGCSSDPAGASGSSGASSGTSGTSNTAGASGTAVCEGDPRALTYAPGMVVQSASGAFAVALDSIAPDPVSKGDNAWTLHIDDAQGAAVDGATISLKPFMPDHGHGSSIRPQITAGSNGNYDVTNLNLFMPGVWQITVTVTSASKTVDTAVFTFCVEG